MLLYPARHTNTNVELYIWLGARAPVPELSAKGAALDGGPSAAKLPSHVTDVHVSVVVNVPFWEQR